MPWGSLDGFWSNPPKVIIDPFSGLETPMPKTIPHIVERISLFFVQHPVCETVSQGVWSDIICVAATAIDFPWANPSNVSNIVQHVPDTLFSDPICLPRWEQCSGIFPSAGQIAIECTSGI
jgi:hypothetical protein